MADTKKLRVTLVRSTNGCRQNHRATVRGLGLRRIRHTVELEDTPAVRGMLQQVAYLVRVEPQA
jgi:large subunit ribosomal protein L30